MSKVNIIAIDGPAASGKSTVGKIIAEWLGFLYFDTGLMYRALTWAAEQHRVDFNDGERLAWLASEIQIDIQPPTIQDGRSSDVFVNGQDVTWEIRHPDIDERVSIVSMHPEVREALGLQQRRIGLRGRVVMVGRDIGTIVLPEADIKIYLEASVEERARRRYAELRERGEAVEFEAILESMQNRDTIDSSREVAPLKPATDAIVIDTNGMSIDLVFEKIKKIIEQKNHIQTLRV